METKRLFTLFFLCCFFALPNFAQQTSYYQSVDQKIEKAKELFRKSNYASALQQFEQIAETTATDSEIHSEANYFKALCSLKMNNGNAEELIAGFVNDFPASPYKNQAWFELANNQFEHKKYSQVVKSFKEIKLSGLTQDDQIKLRYINGYSYFSMEKYDEAANEFFAIKETKNTYAAPARYYWAHIHYLKENYETALTEFLKLKDDRNFAKVVPFYISQIYYKQEKYAEVVEYTVPLLAKVQKDEQYELAKIIGNSYFHIKQFDKAIPHLETYFKSGDRKGREENYMLGYCYYLNKEQIKAVSFLENASKGNDLLAQNAYYHLADSYIAANDKNKARTAFEAASKLDFDEKIKEDALFNYAKITYELSYSPFNETIKAFDKYISLYPNSERNDVAYDYLVKVYMSTRNYRDAIASIDKIKVKSPSVKKAYQRVTYYRALEDFNNLDYQSALEYFDKSLEYGQYNRDLEAKSIFWKAEAYYRLEDYNQSIEGYSKFLRSPGTISLPEYQTAHYNIAYAYFKLKDYANASSWFRKYITNNEASRNEKVADALNRLGDCYFIERDFTMALQNYEKSYKMNLYDADYALFQKAFCQGIQRENEQKIGSLRALLQSYPKSQYTDDALYELGRVYERINQPQIAVGYYETLIKDFPKGNNTSKALLQLGLICYNKNDYSKSNTYYKQVAEQYPNSTESQAALSGIKNNYVELNDVNAYFDYTQKLGTGAIVSVSEQDSLSYLAAEKLFMASDKKAKVQFENYLNQFPYGSFVLNSSFYLGECRYSDGEFDEALPNYEYVLAQPDNDFTEQALAKASEIIYSQENYPKALAYYERLEKIANSKWNLLVARAGKMRCLFETKDFKNTIDAAKLLLSSDKLTDVLKRDANYMLAVSYYQTEKYDLSLPVLGNLATDVKSKEGAEAKFLIADILFRKNKLNESEKEIMDFIDKNTPHQYWLAKSFILLADIFLKRNDEFQAKHTLKSMVENYPEPNDGILDEAREKLKRLEDKELQQQQQDSSKAMEIKINPTNKKK